MLDLLQKHQSKKKSEFLRSASETSIIGDGESSKGSASGKRGKDGSFKMKKKKIKFEIPASGENSAKSGGDNSTKSISRHKSNKTPKGDK